MEWKFIIALIFAIPIILFPVAFLWYINIGGMVNAFSRIRQKKAARNRSQETVIVREERHGFGTGTSIAHRPR